MVKTVTLVPGGLAEVVNGRAQSIAIRYKPRITSFVREQMALPDGWTDDMTFPVPEGTSLDQLVDFVISALLQKLPDIPARLIDTFNLSTDDAVLLCDRVCGGIVRAATRNEMNRPEADKDPAAALAFSRAVANAQIIRAIYPELAIQEPAASPRKPWWQFWG